MSVINEKLWRGLTHFWTTVFMILIVLDFFTHGQYEFLIAPFSAIYISILGLYVSTKEFDRWYEMHTDSRRHPGEIFVLLWTIILVALLAVASIWRGYHVSSETVAVYIMVLSVFALTQKSKKLHNQKLARRRKKT